MPGAKVLSVAVALGVAGAAVWLVLTTMTRPQPCTDPTSPAYSTPIGAALSSVWRQAGMRLPARLALNVPPNADIDLGLLDADVDRWHVPLTLFRDTSLFARARISIDSLRVLRIVYDVRPLTRSEWNAYWAMVWSGFPQTAERSRDSVIVTGSVHRVAYESCRGWPCHGDTYVEVRSTGSGYLGCRVLLSGVE